MPQTIYNFNKTMFFPNKIIYKQEKRTLYLHFEVVHTLQEGNSIMILALHELYYHHSEK